MKDRVCVQCGEYESDIKKREMCCAIVGPDTEDGYGEIEYEWPRHRYKPYSAKELESQRRDEEEYIKQMGDFADFCKE